MKYKNEILTFYREEQSVKIPVGYSKSPNKPKMLLDWLKSANLDYFPINHNWSPFNKSDFLLAHTEEYVDSFFSGGHLAGSNGLSWDPAFAESVRYTNASLFYAILNSIEHPGQITFSPTSGFHHARPDSGSGFCTFSGQVIASIKIFQKYTLSGAYIDLDQHYGNSIEDSRDFCSDLNRAVPLYANINPSGEGERYIKSLKSLLDSLTEKILMKEIHYLVLCSGADSLRDDDLGHSLSLEEWLECKKEVYEWIGSINRKMKKHIPITITLFGGYRSDHFESVLDAHTQDLLLCLSILSDTVGEYQSVYRPKNSGR